MKQKMTGRNQNCKNRRISKVRRWKKFSKSLTSMRTKIFVQFQHYVLFSAAWVKSKIPSDVENNTIKFTVNLEGNFCVFSQRKKILVSNFYEQLSNCQGICLGFNPYIDGSGKVEFTQFFGFSVADGYISGIVFGRQRYMVSVNQHKEQTNLKMSRTRHLYFSVWLKWGDIMVTSMKSRKKRKMKLKWW